MKIKDFVDKEYQCNTFKVENYEAFVEILEPIDGIDDILVELFKNGEFLFNCLEYKGHCFTKNTEMSKVEKYVKAVIETYRAIN